MIDYPRKIWALYLTAFVLLNLNVVHCAIVTCLDSNPWDTSPSYTDPINNCFINQPISLPNGEKLTFIVNGNRNFEDVTRVEFLKSAENSYADITSVPREIFTIFPKLAQLNLTTNIQSISREDFTNTENLIALTLRSGLKTIPTKVFSEIKNLTFLTLSNNQITNIEDNAFDGLNSLSSLELGNNKLTILKRSTFSELPLLRTLQLEFNNIETIEEGALNLPSLTLITLNNNKLKTVTATTFQGLNKIFNILLNNNEITNINLEVLSQLPSLRGISLADNLIEWNNATAIENYQSSNSQLSYFDISGNRLSNGDILKRLALFSKLEILNIQKNQFVALDYQTKPLKEVFPNLKKVYLGENKWECSWLNGFVAQLKSDHITAATLISLGGTKSSEIEDIKCDN